MARIYPTIAEEQAENDRAPTREELEAKLIDHAHNLVAFSCDPRVETQEVTLEEYEETIMPRVLEIGCAALALYLLCSEERIREQTPTKLVLAGRTFEKRSAKPRTIMSRFGSVRYWRTYMAQTGVRKGQGHGFYPLDQNLGLTKDKFSFGILALMVRLSTLLPFATAKATAELFLPEVPSVEVIEQATLGFGRYTQRWFEFAEPPDDDGDVLVILFDGKGTPQATEEELVLRRGPRFERPKAPSPRHRGRQRRGHCTKKKHRKPDDKSKNARMATMVVMYTLRTVGDELHGPINKWHYASFAPKKHAFAVAWREARKRGFDPNSDDVIQIITDGDDDLARYAKLFFPNAIHTLDVIHVVERLWKAGACIFGAGSEEQEQWVEEQKDLLYRGQIKDVLRELRARRQKICRSQKNKNRREQLKTHIDYLHKRTSMMNYDELVDADMEIGSGAVEGAIKHIIGKRCDQGGMRWIVERNEAVVQLRCIEVNGDWERFASFVHEQLREQHLAALSAPRIQQKAAEPLPDMLTPPGWEKAA